jgi:hypothetical protein
LQCSNCVDNFFHHVSSMWPTPYLEGGDGSNKEDQVCIDIRKWFRKKLSFVFLLICLCFTLRALHFALLCASSFVTYSFPCLCINAHCWSVNRIRDVSGLTFMFLKPSNYILHSTFCVCALCMHFLSLQKKKNCFWATFYNMFVHFFLCIYLSSL